MPTPSRTDDARVARDVPGTRLRARRRDVAVRRARPGPRRPGRGRRSSRTTTRARPSAARRRRRTSACSSSAAGRRRRHAARVLAAGAPTGRSTASTASFPADARLRLIPHDRRAPGGRGGSTVTRPRAASCRPASCPGRSRSAASTATSLSISASKAGARTTLPRHAPRVCPSTTAPTVSVVNDLPLEHLPARRRAGRDAVDLAGRGAAGPGHRRALVRRAQAATRRLVLRQSRRHAVAGLPRRAGRTAGDRRRDRRRPPAWCCGAGRRSPTRCSTRPAAGRPSTTRTSSCRRPGRRSPAP